MNAVLAGRFVPGFCVHNSAPVLTLIRFVTIVPCGPPAVAGLQIITNSYTTPAVNVCDDCSGIFWKAPASHHNPTVLGGPDPETAALQTPEVAAESPQKNRIVVAGIAFTMNRQAK